MRSSTKGWIVGMPAFQPRVSRRAVRQGRRKCRRGVRPSLTWMNAGTAQGQQGQQRQHQGLVELRGGLGQGLCWLRP